MAAVWIGNGWHPALFRTEANSLGKIKEVLHPRVVIVENESPIENSAFIDHSLSPFDFSFIAKVAEDFKDLIFFFL